MPGMTISKGMVIAMSDQPKRVATLDLDAIEARLTSPGANYFTLGTEDVPDLIAEVRRLTESRAVVAANLAASLLLAENRAESAEAEVVTLRAKVAAVEALHNPIEIDGAEEGLDGAPLPGGPLVRLACDTCTNGTEDNGFPYHEPWPCPTFAALATTGEGQCSNCRQPLTSEPCTQPDGNGGKVAGHWIAGGPSQAQR